MNVNARGHRIVNVGAKPGERTNPAQLCLRGKFLPGDITHHPSRVTTPLIKRNGKWVEVNWKEAIQFTANGLEKNRENRFGMIGSAQDSLEENYVLQKFSRAVMHSNNVDLFASYPDRDMIMEMQALVSSFQGKIKDLEKADTILILGADASVSHPLVENRIRKASRQGKNVLYANPQSTRTSQFASLEVHYSPGEAYYLLYLLAARLAGDSRSARQAAMDFADMDAFINILVKSRNLMIVIGDDIFRNNHAKDVLRTLGYLISLKRENARASLLILGYEGNVFAGALAGAHPDILPGFELLSNKKAIQKWNGMWKK
jgi:predicted molibdopterin-dependent oxidoreductase YjgC